MSRSLAVKDWLTERVPVAVDTAADIFSKVFH